MYIYMYIKINMQKIYRLPCLIGQTFQRTNKNKHEQTMNHCRSKENCAKTNQKKIEGAWTRQGGTLPQALNDTSTQFSRGSHQNSQPRTHTSSSELIPGNIYWNTPNVMLKNMVSNTPLSDG